MWNKKLFIFLLCLTTTYTIANAQAVVALTAVMRGVGFLFQAYKFIAGSGDSLEVNEEIRYRSITNSIEELKLKIERLDSDEADVTNMKARMYDLQIKSDEVDRYYQKYLEINENPSRYDESTLKEFAKQMLNENVGLPNILFYIHENTVGLNNGSLVDIMERYIEYINPYCQRLESRQRYFYDLFISVVTHEIKGFLILEYAYELKKKIYNVTFEQEMKDLHKYYKQRILETKKTFRDVILRSEADMWKCDNEPVDGKTYTELKNVFRRIFYEALDFTDKHKSIICETFKCPAPLTVTESYCQSKRCHLPQRHCKNVVNCNKLTYDDEYDVCVSPNQDHGRRYSYVHKHDHHWNAAFKNKHCDGEFRNVVTLPGGPWAGICNACSCICDESEDSDRFISLKPVLSDLENNYVITGVQLVVQNHTLYIKIQQGELLQYGFINSKTVEWKEVVAASDHKANYFIDEPQIVLLHDDQVHSQYESPQSNSHVFEGNEKYRLDWLHRRGLYLDDLILKKNELVTGVRFDAEQNENKDGYMKLDIQATPFNYTTGKLETDNSYWLSVFKAPSSRDELNLEKTDSPISLNNVTNKPDKVPHQRTKFTPSDYLSKDAGQTTLPLIDIQPVAVVPAAPLSGISLDIKKSERSGGYLILKTTPYNVLWHFNE